MASLDDAYLALRPTTDDGKEECPSKSRIISQEWQLGKSLNASLLHLYENQLLTDISFRCRDHGVNERLKAHKVILAARSPVLQAMFYGPCAEQSEEIELPVVDAKIFHLVLKYIYSDTTELTELDAGDVLMVAHMYQIYELTEFCAKYLASVIKTDNACDILEIALVLQIESLIEAACDFIDDHADLIIESEHFLNTSTSCLDYILNGDTFCAEESTILKAISKCDRNEKAVSNSEHDKSMFKYIWHKLTNNFTSEHAQKKDRKHAREHLNPLAHYYTIKRLPRTQTISVPLKSSKKKLFSSNLQCCILILASKDCVIQNIKFYNLELYTYSLNFRFRQKISNDLIFINGSLFIDDEFIMRLIFTSFKGEIVSLSDPIKLVKRDKPYTMKIMLDFNQFSTCALENPRKSRTRNCTECEHAATCLSFLNDNFKNEYLKVSYCTDSQCVNIVDSLRVCFSF